MTTTGPEIWKQTRGRIDAFCCGVGTGGTLSGVSLFLKSKNPSIQSVLIDPDGSVLLDYFSSGEMKSSGSSISEGIGQGRLCDNLTRDEFRPDLCLRVSDAEAMPVAYDLLQREALAVGTSSAVNVAGAIKLARQLGPGKTIVTILADHGTRYQSKMFNESWLRDKSLPVPEWLDSQGEEGKQRAQLAAELRAVALLPQEDQPKPQ